MSTRISLATINKLCDDGSQLLVTGYIRSICQDLKSSEGIKLSHSDLPFQISPLCIYYFVSSNLFDPESVISYNTNTNKTWSISKQSGHSWHTLQEILKVNKSGDKIQIYPGEYIIDAEDTAFLSFYESVQMIGMGEGVILKMDMNFYCDATVYLKNLIIHTSENDSIADSAGCIDLRWNGKNISLYLEECQFFYEELCVGLGYETNISVYVNNCLFQGRSSESRSSIDVTTSARSLTVIGSEFKECGRCKDTYYTNNSTVNNQYPCIRIGEYSETENKISIICIGNTFYDNDGHPIAKMVSDEDDDPEWYTKDMQCFLADNVTNNEMNGNVCRSILFPDDIII